MENTYFPTDNKFTAAHTNGYTALFPGKDEVDSTSWSPSQAYSAGQMTSNINDLTKWARLVGKGEFLSAQLRTERLQWQKIGDNNDEWHYTFGLEENSGWLGHNGEIPGFESYMVYNPKLDATIALVLNTDKRLGNEPPINVLLRDISALLFPNNPVRVPTVG